MDFEVKLEENQKHTTVELNENQEEIVTEFKNNSDTFTVQFGEHQESFNAQLGETQAHTQVNIGDYQTLQGVGIEKIEKTKTEGLDDTYVITLTNGKTYSFIVTNGIVGKDGKDGKDGYTPQKNVDYFDGKDGKDGYTPIKDVDYFDGKDGRDGIDGTDGVGIERIAFSNTDGKVDTYVITLTNGNAYAFTVTNGNDYVLTEADKIEIAELTGQFINLTPYEKAKLWVEEKADELEANVNEAKEWVKGTGADIKDWIDGVGEGVSAFGEKVKSTVADANTKVENSINEVKDFLTGVGEDATEFTQKAEAKIKDVLKDTTEAANKAKEWVDEKADAVEKKVDEAKEWVEEQNEKLEGFFGGVKDVAGDIGEGVVNIGQKIGGLFKRTKDVEEKTNGLADYINSVQNNITGANWLLNDTISSINVVLDITFVANDVIYKCMRITSGVGFDEGHNTIIYVRQDDVEFLVYDNGWVEDFYKNIIVQNPTEHATETLRKIAGVTWELKETITVDQIIDLAFVSNGINFKRIRVNRGVGFDEGYDIIIFVRQDNDSEILVYDTSNGWYGDYKNITVFNPTEYTNTLLRKIAVEKTEKLTTISQTLFSAINEVNSNVGNLDELETEEVATFSTRSVEKKSLVRAVNNVHRKTKELEEYVIELEEKVDAGGSGEGGGYKITTLKGTTWLLNNEVDVSTEFAYNVNFTTSNGKNFTSFNVAHSSYFDDHTGRDEYYRTLRYGNSGAYITCEILGSEEVTKRWAEAKTITFTGGADINNINLVNYLYANGKLTSLDLSHLQDKEDETLETEDKTVVGAINEVNSKTIDKIIYLNFQSGNNGIFSCNEEGIGYENEYEIETVDGYYHYGSVDNRIPIVAGENVTFEVDEENQVVKINAKGGGSNDSVVGTWKFEDEIRIPSNKLYFEVSFISNGYNYLAMDFTTDGYLFYSEEIKNFDQEVYYEGWVNQTYRTIKILEEPTDPEFITWLKANATKQGEDTPSKPCFEMPQIRFVGMPCSGYFGYVDGSQAPQGIEGYTNLKFTIEIVGGGALQVGDAIQICRMGYYGANRTHPRKRKLRRLFEYVITEEDLNKRFITFEVPYNDKKAIKLFTKWATPNANDKSIYFRIRRPKGEINSGSNGGGMTVDAEFSNVVSVRCYSYPYSWMPDGDDGDEVHFYHIKII